MAGSDTNPKCESFGNRNLWQFVSGTGVLRPKELIQRELTRNKEKLLNGLLFYKIPSAPQGELLKDEKLSKPQKDLVQKLSVFLGMEEDQSYDLFCSYISQDFRGSQKNLQLSLSTERHCHTFMLKVRDFYYTERLYLLQTVRHILTYWPDTEHHPYKEEYTEFVNILLTNNRLVQMLISQLDLVCDASLPSWENHGNLMNDRQSLVWAHQNLKEQMEILETLLVYWKDFEASVTDFNKLLEKFKRQGFGRRQAYKHKLDDSSDRLLKRIGSLEVLVLLQALDMETVERLSQDNKFMDHSLLKDKQTFQSVDKNIQLLGSEQPHGPVLLSWAVIRQLYLDGDGGQVTRKIGNLALQLNVFDFLLDLLDREPFSGKSMTASLSHCVIYTVLLAALTAFDETTLARNTAEIQILYNITSKLMKREFVAGNVWHKGLDQGMGNMFQTALLNFPLDFSTLVKLSTSLASATSASASKVLELWSELPRYTEYLDRNSSTDIKATRDTLVWQLARDKTPYTAGDFRISAGVFGQLISAGRKSMSDMEIPIIQWQVTYDGWQLLKCEIQELLHQVSKGAGMVSPIQVARVTDITEFVRAICTSQPEATEGLADIISLMYTLVHRFSSFSPPPLDLLSACVDTVTCVAKLNPKQAWHDMKQTGLLPFLTENIDNTAEVLSGQGLSPGLYGALLASCESVQGRYPLTIAYLDFVSELIMPMYKIQREGELMPCVMYILREIFPVFQKWRYYNSTRKEIIGQKCLNIANKVLNLRLTKEKKASTRPHLQGICVFSLLFTEAGRSLLEIIATGVENVEMLLSQQSSQSEGSGEELVQLIQVGFSVMNRLLLLRSHDQKMSPVEVALSSQPAGYQNQHIVAVIAEYIYHRTNPLLSKLATLFLRRLAVVLPMSILACLGNQAEPIRDIYLMRLQSVTEDLSLKTGILELLSVCVDTQPGLIEIFLNVQSQDKEKKVGVSCLQTVLDLMDQRRQSSYQCPPHLLCACMDFMAALWMGLRETAMAALRAKSNFWSSMCEPLMKDLPESSDKTMLSFKLKTVSHILRVLAQEIFTMKSTSLDNNLKKMLKQLSEKGRLKYWSTYITECIQDVENGGLESSLEGSTEIVDHPTHKLLNAWTNFLIVTARINVAELKLEDGLKEMIVVDLLDAIHVLFNNPLTELSHKLSQTIGALYFTLVKIWTSSLKSWPQILQRALGTLLLTMSSGDMVIPSVQIGLLGSITAILQYIRIDTHKKVEMQKLEPILNAVCEVLLQGTRELPTPKQLRESHAGTDKSFSNTDHKLKLQVVCCCLVDELLHHIKEVEMWLPILQENMILTALLSSATVYLKAHEGVHYIQPLFILFLTIAQSDKGAEALSQAGLTQHVCLPITYCYQNGDNSSTSQTSTQTGGCSQVSWHSIYCLCIELYTSMLHTLKFSFLDDAFNFVGSHQDRLQQCLNVARLGVFTDESFTEVEKTCHFVCQLSHFSRDWRLHLPDSLNAILTSMMYMCQTFVSYLIRPKYLQHVLQQHGCVDRDPVKRGHKVMVMLQHQSSTEDVDSLSPRHVQVQRSMLHALGQCLVALRQFSPDLVQILVDQNMDIGEFEPFLSMGFSTPPVDQDTPPTFGTILSCISVCMRLLSKIEPRSVSPQKGDQTQTVTPGGEDTTLQQTLTKSLVKFVMENCLYITMSQGMLYLKDPSVPLRDKQLLKRELGTEMNSLMSSIQRYYRRSGPQSPASATQPSPRASSSQQSPRAQSPGGATLSRSISQTFPTNQEQAIFRLVQEFCKQVLR